MLRLCLTVAGCCALLGCGGGDPLEGSWYGALPFDGTMSCRIRLKKSHEFDFACGTLRGTGTYASEAQHLKLTFTWMGDGDQKLDLPAPLDMQMERYGNQMDLKLDDGHHLKWERRME